MQLKRLGFAFAAAVLAATPALAGEELLFAPPGDWVTESPAVEDTGQDPGLPVRVLQLDRQVRLEKGRRSIFAVSALKFQSPQGLDAGNISFAWRPETDDLTIHSVIIRRGDEIIDVLGTGQTFSVLRREQNLERATLDGVLTANLFPEDLQVGDILEIATTLTTSDPVLAGHVEDVAGPLNIPAGRISIRLQWPAGLDMQLAKSMDMPDWKRSKEKGFETASIVLENVQPILPPRDAPLRYGMVRFLQATDFDSWDDVVALKAPLYRAAAKLPAEGPLRVEVERIRDSSSDPVARAEAALRLVQNRVRYVALAMGEGGLVPADAAVTWSRRYGDCKGKTALLLAILDELGIDAEPVLVHSQLGDTLPQRLPTVSAFDHVLVRARIDGRDYWLDGTRSGDTSLARLTVLNFGWGLPLGSGQVELVRMVPAPLDEPHSDLAIHMDARNGIRAPVPTRVELTLRGDAAVGTEQVWANLAGETRERALRDYWRGQYDFIEPDAVDLAFDEAAGELRMTLEGQATLDWDGVWYQTDGTRLGYQADFTRQPGHGSDAPFAVLHPFYSRTRQTILLPPGFTADATRGGEAVDEVVAGVEYRRHTTFADDTFFVEATERSIEPEFPAAAAPAAQKRLRELWDKVVYLRIPNGYRPTPADLAAIGENAPDSAPDLVAQGHELRNAGRYDEAIALFDRATELDARNAFAWANRGIALVDLNRPEEAAASFDRAAEIDPDNFVVFNGRGRLAEMRRDWKGAIAAYTRAIEANPPNEYALGRRANMHLAAAQPDLALADAAEALQINPKQVQMYGLRSFILSREGRRDEAAAEIAAMMAALPGDPAALGIATQIYNDLGMRDEALALAERAVADAPTALVYFNLSRGRDPMDTAGKLADLGNALELDPQYGPALFDRASLYFGEREYEKALADTEVLLGLSPRPPDVYVLRANIFRALGRPDDAVAEAVAIVAANPDQTYAHVAAGKIYSQFGMRAEALAAMDRALAIRPEPLIYINRSQVRDPDDREARLADLDEALRLDPTAITALYLKADLLSETGDHAAAAEALAGAVEADSPDPGLLNVRGIALAKAGRSGEAEQDFARARELATDAMALNNLCYPKALADVALERALEECEESLRLRPDFAPTLDSRGAVLLRLGRLDEAIRDFDRVLEQMPHLSNSRYLRAVARSRKGERAGAEADLEAVRKDNPELVRQMERQGFAVVAEPADGG